MSSSSADPASLLHKVVKIHSLSSKPELNNKLGTVTLFSTERNRYLVELYPPSSPPSSTTISIRAENLIVASWTEKAQVQLVGWKNQALTLYRDPQVRQQVQYLYNRMDRHLPKSPVKMHPEHLLIASVLVFLLTLWLLGITRTILILSLASITFMVALEDIVPILSQPSGQSTLSATALFKTIVQNFPMRWRNVVAQTIGWPTISRRFALALWFGLVFFMGTVLWTSPSKNNYKRGNYNPSQIQTTYPSTSSSSQVPWTLEDIYKMGFDDASHSLEYASSLPKDVDNYRVILRSKNTMEPISNPISPLDEPPMEDVDPYPTLDYMAPPPPKRKGGPTLGYTTIAAFYSLFRVIRELGFHGGKFDFRLFIANLKNLQPWRLGLIGLSLYKVLSTFLF